MDITNSKIGTVLELAKSIPEEKKEYMNSLFQEAPLWLMDCMSIQKYEKDEVLIRENDSVDKVFILIEGVVKAVDHRIFGIEYDYMRFTSIQIFGSMEILLDISSYKTTLNTVTPCTFLVMKAERFKEWIEKDINAMQIETKAMGSYLLEQGRRERTFLFLNGIDRLFLVFIRSYEHQRYEHKKCILSYTRQELSDCSGISIKTINRSIKKMEEEGFINRRGNKILISQEQYEQMQEYIKNIISEE